MEGDEQTVVVLDVGTATTKCGFAGDDAPRSVFSTIVGHPRMPGIMVGMDMNDAYVGDAAVERHGVLNISYPMVRRQVQDWEDMIKLWHHAFYNELKVAPDEHSLLLSEPPLNPLPKKEKIMELMFEEFTVPSYYSAVGASLGLFASGATIGIVVDSGEGATHTVPVYEGYCCQHAINELGIAGNEVTNFLRDLLDARGYSFTTPSELDIVKDIKRYMAYVSENFKGEKQNELSDTQAGLMFEMPDGHTILVKAERFEAAEALFKPSLYGVQDDGIHHKLYQSVMKCDQDIRKEMYGNILLVGGTTLIRGLKERLRKDVKNLAPVGTNTVVNDPPERETSVWIGGSILASLNTFQRMCVTKQQYEEHGHRIVHIKC